MYIIEGVALAFVGVVSAYELYMPLPPQIGSAAGVIRQLRSNKLLYTISTNDTPILDHTPMIRDEEGGSSDPFSTVLMFYSSRALDFPQPVLIQSTPMQTRKKKNYDNNKNL